MSNSKQEWVYTEDGLELSDKASRSPIKGPKLNKSYFVIPWVVLGVLVIASFASGGVGIAYGILLVLLGPLVVVAINFYTLKRQVLDPLRSKAEDASKRFNR